MIEPAPRRVLRTDDVCRVCGISRASLHRLRTRRDFPAPIKLGPQAIGWRMEDIETWLAERPTAVH